MCNYEEIISALKKEFQGELQNSMQRSNPLLVENGNNNYLEYVVVIFSFNQKIEEIFVVRVEKDKAFVCREFTVHPEFDKHVINKVLRAKVLEDDYVVEFEKVNGGNLVLEFL